MQAITTIGLDIAKSVFQVHGVDAAGQVVIRRQLKRRYVLAFFGKLPPCLVGIEACAILRAIPGMRLPLTVSRHLSVVILGLAVGHRGPLHRVNRSD
jgi:transposase